MPQRSPTEERLSTSHPVVRHLVAAAIIIVCTGRRRGSGLPSVSSSVSSPPGGSGIGGTGLGRPVSQGTIRTPAGLSHAADGEPASRSS